MTCELVDRRPGLIIREHLIFGLDKLAFFHNSSYQFRRLDRPPQVVTNSKATGVSDNVRASGMGYIVPDTELIDTTGLVSPDYEDQPAIFMCCRRGRLALERQYGAGGVTHGGLRDTPHQQPAQPTATMTIRSMPRSWA